LHKIISQSGTAIWLATIAVLFIDMHFVFKLNGYFQQLPVQIHDKLKCLQLYNSCFVSLCKSPHNLYSEQNKNLCNMKLIWACDISVHKRPCSSITPRWSDCVGRFTSNRIRHPQAVWVGGGREWPGKLTAEIRPGVWFSF